MRKLGTVALWTLAVLLLPLAAGAFFILYRYY